MRILPVAFQASIAGQQTANNGKVAQIATKRPKEASRAAQSETRAATVRPLVEMIGRIVRYQRQHRVTAEEAAQSIRDPKAAEVAVLEFTRFMVDVNDYVADRAQR